MVQFYSDNNLSLLSRIAAKNQKSQLDDDHIIAEFVIEKKSNNDFHLKRGLQSTGIKTLVCKICGSNSFQVGQDDYFTAVKCVECGYELGIHEG